MLHSNKFNYKTKTMENVKQIGMERSAVKFLQVKNLSPSDALNQNAMKETIIICDDVKKLMQIRTYLQKDIPGLIVSETASTPKLALPLLGRVMDQFVLLWFENHSEEWLPVFLKFANLKSENTVLITHDINVLHHAVDAGLQSHELELPSLKLNKNIIQALGSPKILQSAETLVLNRRNSTLIVPVSELNMIFAKGAYSLINYSKTKQNEKCSKNLGYFTELLGDNRNFTRVSRSLIINMPNVRSIRHYVDKSGEIIFNNGYTYPVSREIKNRIINSFKEANMLSKVN